MDMSAVQEGTDGTVADPISLTLEQKVEELLWEVFGGNHRVKKVLNKNFFFEVVPHGSVSTFDDNRLTKLVKSCHRLGVRAEITNHGMIGIKILLHNRINREGGQLWSRHPGPEALL